VHEQDVADDDAQQRVGDLETRGLKFFERGPKQFGLAGCGSVRHVILLRIPLKATFAA
jgi:hypothetical protein